ncbi:hypothetical protein [uncultured Fibrobacter sp.]|uniref:hypothetical protein n=1 Tax=uncultured Fibrobacter sp. TaxID=261512 RepID=UPI0025EF21E7|nr:hypothetical protein [uncultured Fibrobacter sp.]
MKRPLNILIACEESQAVCKAFRKLGHNAYSCDLLACSGEHPEWHFNHDVTEVLNKTNLILQNGKKASVNGMWDLMIGHPPCTYLAVSGAQWYYHPDDKNLPVEKRRPHPKYPNRAKDREDGVNFFMLLANARIKRIAIENPVGIMSNRWRKPDQKIQPYEFGDPYSKGTCLWLKNLWTLHPSKETEDHGEKIFFKSGKSQPKWYSEALSKAKTPEERRTLRSKTFPGIARAMAEQWSIQIALEENLLTESEKKILGADYKTLDRLNDEQIQEIEKREQQLISFWLNKR